jgi:hypothetical protein
MNYYSARWQSPLARKLENNLFLMQPQSEVQRVGVTIIQAARQHALKNGANLLLYSFNADSHVHIC